MNALMFWGYLHSNGSVNLKRWFGDPKDYMDDCDGNEFVVRVVRPFAAQSRDQAMDILTKRLGVGR